MTVAYSPQSQRGAAPTRIKFHAGQTRLCIAQLLQPEARFIFARTGTGWGKTEAACTILTQWIKEQPGKEWIVISPKHGTLNKVVIPRLVKHFAASNYAAQYVGGDQAMFRLPCGGRIYAVSGETPGQMQGIVASGIWIDEGGDIDNPDVWQTAQQRVGYTAGTILVTTTPYVDDPDHWLERAYARWQEGDPLYFVQEGSTLDNPYYPRDVVEQARAEWPAWKFAMRFEGKTGGKREGQIYPEWQRMLEYDSLPWISEQPPADWLHYDGLDFGFNNPTGYELAALSPDDVLWLFAEHYERGMRTDEHGQEVANIRASRNLITGWADSEGKQQIADLANMGVYFQPAIKHNKLSSFDLVNARIATDRIKIVRGSCPNLRRELPGYVWKRVPGTERFSDVPLEKDNHALDAMLYLVRGVDTPVAREETEVVYYRPARTLSAGGY